MAAGTTLPVFDGGGLSALSGIPVAAGEPAAAIDAGGANTMSGVTGGITSNVQACGATPSLSTVGTTAALGNSPLGAMPPGSNGTVDPVAATSIAAVPADIVPNAPCIGADTSSEVAPSLSVTINSSNGSADLSSAASAMGSSARMPGSRITGMGGTGELPDPLTAANEDGASVNATNCAGGPLAMIQRTLTRPTTSTTIGTAGITSTPSAMTPGSSGSLSLSSGME